MRALIVPLLFLATPALAQGRCVSYEPEVVTLAGTVHEATAYGPPGFGDTPEIDAKQNYESLTLDMPLCVLQGDAALDEGENGVQQVQLVPSSNDSLASNGSRISVTGTLFHGHTGYHHTKVLMQVTRVNGDDEEAELSQGIVREQHQTSQEMFSFPTGLNVNGDNWVALRSLPSAIEGTRLARLGPDILFTEIGSTGDWAQVRLLNGRVGWISARYVGCCRAATALMSVPSDRSVERSAQPASCGDLWYRRNSIFKAAGFCFHSARGINAFGNIGCRYDLEAAVPLSARERDEVALLQGEERDQGCQR